ncbi:HET-domain-containing protein [Xylariaceae sp. AK1471]|nr:HET-domain-containing protein [Xylariaceae sp. AK1471]
MASTSLSSIKDQSSNKVSASPYDHGDQLSSCDFCSKLLSIISLPFEEQCEIALGKFSEVIAADCPHSEWVRNVKFTTVKKGPQPHWCQKGDLRGIKFSDGTRAQLYKSCRCGSSHSSTLSWTESFGLAVRADEPSSNGSVQLIDSQWINTELIRSWHTRCRRDHGSECDSYRVRGLGSTQPEWLIDTVRGCIIPSNGQLRSYLTLSYTWGQVTNFRALKSNVGQLQRPGVLLSGPIADQIPETIRNAMGITRCLGETFLWTDSLCIVQDNDEALYETLRDMHLIFSNSVLTIVAEDGQNADHGIRGVKGVSRPRSYVQTLFNLAGGETVVFAKKNGEPSSGIHNYHNRMWTFQEYLFSKRRLIFSSGPVIWECNKARWLEHMHSHPKFDLARRRQYNLDYCIESHIPRLRDLTHIIRTFNRKFLTYPEDASFSFSGIQSMLQQTRFPDGLLYGLPEFYFDIALIWLHCSSVHSNRRPSTYFSGDPLHDKLPSWSWIGWQGEVQFLPDSEFESDSRLTDPWMHFGFTSPVTKWFAIKSPTSEPRRAVESRWYESRGLPSSTNPPKGWMREKVSLDSLKNRVDMINLEAYGMPKSWPGFLYTHVSMPDNFFWYSVPLSLHSVVTEQKVQTQYLCCSTSRAFLYRTADRKFDSVYWDAIISDSKGKGVGALSKESRPKTAEVLSNPNDLQLEQIELVAIVKGWVWIDRWSSLGQIINTEKEVTSFDKEYPNTADKELWSQWKKTTARKWDCVYVLRVEWKDGVAYRKAAGFVLVDAWEKHKEPENVHLVLG